MKPLGYGVARKNIFKLHSGQRGRKSWPRRKSGGQRQEGREADRMCQPLVVCSSFVSCKFFPSVRGEWNGLLERLERFKIVSILPNRVSMAIHTEKRCYYENVWQKLY